MSDFPDDIPFFDEGEIQKPKTDKIKTINEVPTSPNSSSSSTGDFGAPISGLAKRSGGLAARAMAARNATQQEPSYLEGLNPEQSKAVITTEGPVLVLAGAGTGKTRVLTTRIAYILSQGLAFPSQILAVTFTNKAAREMKHRIGDLVGGAIEGMPWLGTFHSIGVKMLRRNAELVGLRSDFTILDMDDVIRLLKQIIKAEGLDDKRWPARTLAQIIDGWKNRGLTPEQIPEGDARSFGNGKGRELYRQYQDRLKTLNCCDFGDLLMHPITMFRQNPDVLKEYHKRFKYILVDEYQDTNTAQYLWLRLLAQRPSGEKINLCCVGDDDQSIYGWRGAEIDNILRFEKDFPGAIVIRLERNYRSTAHILGTAAHLIAHNEGRLGKTLFTEKAESDAHKVQVHAAWDSEEEARAVGEEIEQLQRQGHKLNDMSILVRASFQMREFEDRFVSLGLNYRVIGGPRFYERLEIRDALAYFRVVAQPYDDLAFERIVNTPKRGLGEASIHKIHEAARLRNMPMLETAGALVLTDELKPKQRSSIKEVVNNFHRWQGLLDNTPHVELAEIILDESGYTTMWQNDNSVEAPGRLENLKELIRSMEEFESLRSFLEHISLVMDTEQNESTDAVNIMTLHSAKGLEFDTVFLPGWEEGLFPHQRSLDEGGRSGLEEERRLAYVGLTRAKKLLHIWFVSNRRIHGLWQTTIPSRFLDELPEEHVEVTEMETSYGGYGKSRFESQDSFESSYSSPGWARAQKNKTEKTDKNWGMRSGSHIERIGYGEAESGYGAGRTAAKMKTIDGEFVTTATNNKKSDFIIGDRVFHMKFGNGNVASIDGDKLTIDFDKAGQKRVLDNFIKKAKSKE